MTWNENDARRVGAALCDARSRFGIGNPLGADIVFECMKMMAEIDNCTITRGYAPRSLRSQIWHYERSQQEREEAARQRLMDIFNLNENQILAVLGWSRFATPQEIATADSVYDVFQQCLVGNHKDRDWRILKSTAEDKEGTVKSLAKLFHITKRRVYDCRKLQCAAIWNRTKDLIPKKEGIVFHEVAHGSSTQAV